MTDERPATSLSGSTPGGRPRPTRRRILQAAAAAGGLAATGTVTSQGEPEDIVLGGNTPGWEGRSPEAIADETNPTLTLEEGATHVVEWENVDGQPHNFVIEDANGNELVRSEVVSERGATQRVEFEATRAMSEYYCEVHPTSMRGDVSIGGDGGTETPDEETPDEETPDDEGFFPRGPSVGVTTVAEGMTAPTDFAMAGDGRMFVADQTGELWVVDGGGSGPEQVLDVSDRMVTLGEFSGSYADPDQEYDERGLLGVELHPGFADNGRMFIHYSAPPNDETPDGWDHVEVVSEFRVSEGGTVDPDSEQVLLEFQSPQYNHDAGPMAFGPDGYLYVPMGDGGGANDEMYGHVDDWYEANAGGNGQDTTENLLGGVHRIDVDGESRDRPYAIPENNPLVDEEGHLDEYYAWGFRNPFGVSFDSAGRLFVADAGQNLFEEASIVECGGNYGWNVKEGTHCFSTDDPGSPPVNCPSSTPDDVRGGEELVDPIVEYPHTYRGRSEGIVIAGGHVYEAGDVSEIQGGYIFGDWTRDPAREAPDGRLFVATDPGAKGGETPGEETPSDQASTDGDDPGETVPRDRLWEMAELVIEGSEDGRLHRFVRQFGQGNDGEVYVLVNERGVPSGDTGAVLQIVPPGEGETISSGGAGGDGTGGDSPTETGGGTETGSNESDATGTAETGTEQ